MSMWASPWWEHPVVPLRPVAMMTNDGAIYYDGPPFHVDGHWVLDDVDGTTRQQRR